MPGRLYGLGFNCEVRYWEDVLRHSICISCLIMGSVDVMNMVGLYVPRCIPGHLGEIYIANPSCSSF